MFKFNSNHIITGYIKQKLHSFNLPKIRVYVEGEPIIKTLAYDEVDKNPTGNEVLMYVPYIKNGRIEEYRLTDKETNKWEWVPKGWSGKNLPIHEHFYEYGEYVPNYTKNLEIKNNIYDSYTHEYLGDYLRFQRDYNHIDLMPLYNCFSNRICSGIATEILNSSNQVISTFDGGDARYKIYMLPAKLFKEYTIAIDSSFGLEICCGVYGKYQGTNPALSNLPSITYVKINSANFNTPFIYDKLTKITDEVILNNLAQNELNLKLFIKVPVAVSSSITILEGNYLSWNDTINKSEEDKNYYSSKNYSINNLDIRQSNADSTELYLAEDGAYKYITSLQLLKMNTTESYPFADRLLEYLIGNAITPLDNIPDNIERAQKVLALNNILKSSYKGVWSNTIKPVLYNYMNTSQVNNTTAANHDVLGYIDKDIETLFKNRDSVNSWHTIANEDLYPDIYKSDKGGN